MSDFVSGWATSLAALALLPAAAPAASVFTRVIGEFEPQRWIVYEAAPGEANRLVVRDLETDPLQTSVVESGAPLTVLPDCVAHDDASLVALCPTGQFLIGGPGDDLTLNQGASGPPHVEGDEGNDTLRLHYVPPSGDPPFATGGPGDDLLFVARPDVPVPAPEPANFSWRLSGDEGRDVLVGGASADILDGGAGNDVLIARDANVGELRRRLRHRLRRPGRHFGELRDQAESRAGPRGPRASGQASRLMVV